MSTHRPSRPLMVAILFSLIGFWGCSRVDEQIAQVHTGASVLEAIQLQLRHGGHPTHLRDSRPTGPL